jgi:hypothetical protein
VDFLFTSYYSAALQFAACTFPSWHPSLSPMRSHFSTT